MPQDPELPGVARGRGGSSSPHGRTGTISYSCRDREAQRERLAWGWELGLLGHLDEALTERGLLESTGHEVDLQHLPVRCQLTAQRYLRRSCHLGDMLLETSLDVPLASVERAGKLRRRVLGTGRGAHAG